MVKVEVNVCRNDIFRAKYFWRRLRPENNFKKIKKVNSVGSDIFGNILRTVSFQKISTYKVMNTTFMEVRFSQEKTDKI